MQAEATKRLAIEREDWILRKLARIPTTYAEKQWEARNPGYELHAVKSWAEIMPGTKIFRGYEGEENSTFLSYVPDDKWGFTVTEHDEPNRIAGLPAQNRTHSTRWDVKFSRIVVKVD